MEAFVVTTLIGVFGIDEKNKILFFKPFPKDVETVALKLLESKEKLVEEEEIVQKNLSEKGYEAKKSKSEYIQQNLRKLALQYNYFKNDVEFNQFLSKVSIEILKREIKKAIKKDDIVLQVNNALEEIDKQINIFSERLREWFSLHFPEMDKAIKDNEKFAKLVENFGSRERIEEPELKILAEKSIGMEFSPEDIEAVRTYAKNLVELFNLREKLKKYLENLVREVAPNFAEIASPLLAAKLLAKAGNLEKIATAPSTKIQLLGSEKALFRHLRGKGKLPKHGLIFLHPYIQNAPEKLRGKISRILASKLSVAARIDFYSKEYKVNELKKDLDEKVKEILSAKK